MGDLESPSAKIFKLPLCGSLKMKCNRAISRYFVSKSMYILAYSSDSGQDTWFDSKICMELLGALAMGRALPSRQIWSGDLSAYLGPPLVDQGGWGIKKWEELSRDGQCDLTKRAISR